MTLHFLDANLADLRFTVEGRPGAAFRVVRFHAHEGLSELFSVAVEVACDDPAVPLQSMVGLHAALDFGGTGSRQIAGVIARFQQVRASDERSIYAADLVPSVWLLTLRAGCRVFQSKSTLDVVREVLTDAGIPSDRFRFATQGTYAPRDYCVQYRESDWAFVARLLEEEGISWYFEHADGADVLVLAEGPSAFVPLAGDARLPVVPPGGMTRPVDSVAAFSVGHEARTASVRLRDYAFKTPRLDLEAQAQGPGAAGTEVYDFPGEYGDAGLGQRLARVRLEELQGDQRVGRGESDVRRLAPGRKFTLTGHARPDFDGEYLVVSVDHTGEEASSMGAEQALVAAGAEQAYRNSFTCVPAQTAWRPPRRTPQPVIHGVQTAVVVGPPGEEIYTDAHGRVKVQFHWDRQGRRDDKSSCWIRVAHALAGSGYGSIFLPRVGQEVVVAFVEGDPDRPLVVGSVYNQDQTPPYALPGEKTKSTIKTNSTVGGGGFNELRFEDKKGQEEVFLHAQKDLQVRVRNDRRETIGHDADLEVGNDVRETVGNDLHASVRRDAQEDVGRNHESTVGKDRRTLVGSRDHLRVGTELVTEVAGVASLRVGGVHSVMVGGASSHVAGGPVVVVSGASVVVEGASGVTMKTGGNFVSVSSSGVAIQGSMVMINSGGAPGVASPKQAKAAARTKKAKAAIKAVQAKAGKDLKLKVGTAKLPAVRISRAATPLPKVPAPGAPAPKPPVVSPPAKQPPPRCGATVLVECRHETGSANRRAATNQVLRTVGVSPGSTGGDVTLNKHNNIRVTARRYDNAEHATTIVVAPTSKDVAFAPQGAVARAPAARDGWKAGNETPLRLAPPRSGFVWLRDVPPEVYYLCGRGCAHGEHQQSVRVEVFPGQRYEVSVGAQDLRALWEDWRRKVEVVTQTLFKAPLGPGEIRFDLVPPAIKQFDLAWGWKEDTDPTKAYHGLEVGLSAAPLTGIVVEFEAGILAIVATISCPPAAWLANRLPKSLDVIRAFCGIELNVSVSGKYENRKYAGEARTRHTGEVLLTGAGLARGGLRVSIKNDHIKKIQGLLEGGVEVSGAVSVEDDGAIEIGPKVKLKPVVGRVQVELQVGWFDLNVDRTWSLTEEKQLYPDPRDASYAPWRFNCNDKAPR